MLARFLNSFVRHGTLTVFLPSGRNFAVGDGAEPRLAIRLHDRQAVWRLALHPDLALGELYMDGRLTVEGGDVAALLDLLLRNLAKTKPSGLLKIVRSARRLLRPLKQLNFASRAKANVAHHYDLSGKLYDLFLDRDRQYSCAYFSEAQRNAGRRANGQEAPYRGQASSSTARICSVLDIGSGWGGLALDLARDCGAKVLGVTLSEEQFAMAKDRAAARGSRRTLQIRAQGLSRAHRHIRPHRFRRHVRACGRAVITRAFSTRSARLLNDDGVALIHTIGRSDGPGIANPWITKYIFPGGYTPALSEMLPAIERAGLIVTDVEVLRLHYAETLKEWRRSFKAHWREAAALYDERFCRMWEFYLAARKWRSATKGSSCSRCRSPNGSTRFPSPATTCSTPNGRCDSREPSRCRVRSGLPDRNSHRSAAPNIAVGKTDSAPCRSRACTRLIRRPAQAHIRRPENQSIWNKRPIATSLTTSKSSRLCSARFLSTIMLLSASPRF